WPRCCAPGSSSAGALRGQDRTDERRGGRAALAVVAGALLWWIVTRALALGRGAMTNCSWPEPSAGGGPPPGRPLGGRAGACARARRLGRWLVSEVGGEGAAAARVRCDPPPLISVGREGTPAHIRCAPEELRARRWPVRWVNRGGGCLLHLPGQLAIYPVVPVDRHGPGVAAFRERLERVVVGV